MSKLQPPSSKNTDQGFLNLGRHQNHQEGLLGVRAGPTSELLKKQVCLGEAREGAFLTRSQKPLPLLLGTHLENHFRRSCAYQKSLCEL